MAKKHTVDSGCVAPVAFLAMSISGGIAKKDIISAKIKKPNLLKTMGLLRLSEFKTKRKRGYKHSICV